MDDADITAERDVAEAPLRLAASQKTEGPQPNGRCHYCDEIVDDHSRWCNAGCRDMWQKEQRK